MIKRWLMHKKGKVILASRRRWKKYWVVLAANRLLMHDQPPDSATTEDYDNIIAATKTDAQPKPIFGKLTQCNGAITERLIFL
jgi:hypothetical protein